MFRGKAKNNATELVKINKVKTNLPFANDANQRLIIPRGRKDYRTHRSKQKPKINSDAICFNFIFRKEEFSMCV